MSFVLVARSELYLEMPIAGFRDVERQVASVHRISISRLKVDSSLRLHAFGLDAGVVNPDILFARQ